MVICLSTQMYVCTLRGGKISVHRFGGGQKRSARLSRGGACYECERFSEFHRHPPPTARNNDHSLILLHVAFSGTIATLEFMYILRLPYFRQYPYILQLQDLPQFLYLTCSRTSYGSRTGCASLNSPTPVTPTAPVTHPALVTDATPPSSVTPSSSNIK